MKEVNEQLPISDLSDIVRITKKHNLKFGYQESVNYGDEFSRKFKSDQEFSKCFEIVSKAELNPQKTIAGRIFGFFESAPVMRYRIKNEAAYKGLAVHPFILKKSISFFGISKKGVDTKTLEKLFSSYESLVENGTIRKIRSEWDNKY